MHLTTIARRWLPAAAALAVLATLVACAATPAGSDGSESDSGSSASLQDQLVGRWLPTDDGASPNAFIQFAADGTVTLSDGCNGGQGTWALVADALTAQTGPHTEMFCDGYVDTHTWLATTRTISILDGKTLTLAGVDGATVGTLTLDTAGGIPIESGMGDGSAMPVSPTADELTGRWAMSDFDTTTGTFGEMPEMTADAYASMYGYTTFAADGTLVSSDGCFARAGTWAIDGQQLTVALGDAAARPDDGVTPGVIACDDMLAHPWLEGTHAVVTMEDGIHFWDELGNDVGRLAQL